MSVSTIRWALIAVLAVAPVAQAQIYKWVDDRGVTGYGNKPPANARSVTRFDDAESRVSVIPTARPKPADLAREPELDLRVARADRDPTPVAIGDRASVRELEWRERCFAERRVNCSAPTAATHDITPSFAPFPFR